MHHGKEYGEFTWDPFNSREQERRYGKYGDSLQPSHQNQVGPADYSPALLELINDCIRINATERPSAEDALEWAHLGQESIIEDNLRDVRDPLDNKVRLFYRGNEINNLPQGDADLDSGLNRSQMDDLHEDLVDNKYRYTRQGRLKPRYEKFRREIDNDFSIKQDLGLWPMGEGPFRWDGEKVILASEYGREVIPPPTPTPEPTPEPIPELKSTSSDESNSDDDGNGAVGPGTATANGTVLGAPGSGAMSAAPAVGGRARIVPPGYPHAGRRACTDACWDKTICGHVVCCRRGVVIRK